MPIHIDYLHRRASQCSRLEVYRHCQLVPPYRRISHGTMSERRSHITPLHSPNCLNLQCRSFPNTKPCSFQQSCGLEDGTHCIFTTHISVEMVFTLGLEPWATILTHIICLHRRAFQNCLYLCMRLSGLHTTAFHHCGRQQEGLDKEMLKPFPSENPCQGIHYS